VKSSVVLTLLSASVHSFIGPGCDRAEVHSYRVPKSAESATGADALLAGGARKVVLDCAALTYVSSAGLRVFLGGAKKLKTAGGRVAFAALTPAVHEVFELSGFLEVLAVHPSTPAATASLA